MNLAEWKQVRNKSIVIMNDESSVLRSRQNGLGLKGIQYQVKRTIEFQESGNLMTFFFFELDSQLGMRWLMVKIVDDAIEARVLVEPPDYESGNRHDLVLDRDEKWIFQPPKTDNIILNDLVYTESFIWDGVTYNKKRQGDINGETEEYPKPSGFSKQLATLAEYVASEDSVANQQAVLLEIGPAESDDGGLLRLLIGNVVNVDDIEVIINGESR